MQAEPVQAAPTGFAAAQSRGPYTTLNGPVYRATAEGDLRSGIYVLDRHCNGMGFMHGGMISSFADGALAWAVWDVTGRSSVTLKLTMTFLETVRPGTWLEAHPKVQSVHDGVVQVDARLLLNGTQLAARADAVFRTLRRAAK